MANSIFIGPFGFVNDGSNIVFPAGRGVAVNGDLIFGTDNANDIGASGASRPRTIYAGTRVVAPGYTAGSSAGVASFGPSGVTSITVVGGIVTAIS